MMMMMTMMSTMMMTTMMMTTMMMMMMMMIWVGREFPLRMNATSLGQRLQLETLQSIFFQCDQWDSTLKKFFNRQDIALSLIMMIDMTVMIKLEINQLLLCSSWWTLGNHFLSVSIAEIATTPIGLIQPQMINQMRRY